MTDAPNTTGQAVAVKPPPLETGGMLAPIIPRTVDEMFRLATAFHRSGLTPSTLDTTEKVMVAILAGAELGMAPNQAVQAFYVVNNRPTLWGDAIPALLWSAGFKIREWYEGDGDSLTAFCEVTRPAGDVILGEFSMGDAKAADLLGKRGPWQTARKRMLKMRARSFAARDGAADVLKGMAIKEEAEDYAPPIDNGPRGGQRQGSGLIDRLTAREAQPTGGGFSEAFVARETGQRSAAEEIGDDIPAQFSGATFGVDPAQSGSDRTVYHNPVTGEVREAEFEGVDTVEDADHDQGHPADRGEGWLYQVDLGSLDDRLGREVTQADIDAHRAPDDTAQPTLAGLGLQTGAEVAKTQGAGKTIAEQVAAFKAECVGKTAEKLAGMWKRAQPFRAAMDARDPEGLVEFEEWFAKFLADVDDAERAAKQ